MNQSAQQDIGLNFRLLSEGIEQLNVGVSIYDDDLRLVMCNQCFRDVFQVPDEMTVAGAPLGPVINLLAARGAYGPVDPDEFEKQSLQALRNMVEPFVVLRRAADGRVFESRTSRLPTGGFITFYSDVTRYEEARLRVLESQRTLSEKTTELELILENASLGILIVVPGGNGIRIMRRVNRALEELLGYGPGELEGLSTRVLYPNDEEYNIVTAGYFEEVCLGGVYQREHVFACRDGSTMVGILRGSAIDPADPGRGAIWLIEDITERKHIETELAAKTALLQAGTENMPGAMVIWDNDLRYIWWTPRAEHYFNLPPGTLKVGLRLETMTRHFAERGDFGPGDIEAQVAAQMRPFYAREQMNIERFMPNGTVLEVRRNPLPDGGFVSVFQDITARKRMENELRQAKEAAEANAERLRRRQEQVKTLLNSSGQGFLSFGVDLRGDSEYSQACVAMLGGSPAGRDVTTLLFPDDLDARERLRQLVQRILREPDLTERACLLQQLPGEFHRGELFLEANFRLLANGNLMMVLTDVTTERRFRKLSVTDRLTGLANRRKLDEVLAYEHERAARTSSPLSLIIADIDRFKQVNDTRGHQEGDRVLIGVANLLQGGVRKIDCVGRWGGEEFMILCPDTSLAGAEELAEKLRQSIANYGFSVGQVTCSFGAAQYHPGENSERLVKRADEALFCAKEGGRNQVVTTLERGGAER